LARPFKDALLKWSPLVLGVAALAALLGARIARGEASLGFLVLFVVLLPAAFAAALIRWWPQHRRDSEHLDEGIDWHRTLVLSGAGLLLAAIITLLLGVAGPGAGLGGMLLVAGTLLLPPAALVAALGWLLGGSGSLEAELEIDESIVLGAREHWGVLLPPMLVLMLAAILALGPFGVIGYGAAAVLYLLVLPGTGVGALGAYLNTELALTSHHLLIARGLVRRRVQRRPRSQVRACGVGRNWLGRLLGYGRVTVIFTDGSTVSVGGIADPETFRRQVAASELPTAP
jgi:hypothetical protein